MLSFFKVFPSGHDTMLTAIGAAFAHWATAEAEIRAPWIA